MCGDYGAVYVNDLLDCLNLINPYSAKLGDKVYFTIAIV